jgi:hypothetical protein
MSEHPIRVSIDGKSLAIGCYVWYIHNYLIGAGTIKDLDVKKDLNQVWVIIEMDTVSLRGTAKVDSGDVFYTEREALERCIKLCEDKEKELIEKRNIIKINRFGCNSRLKEIDERKRI